MIPKLCDLCGQQRVEKPASLYWAWVLANGRRRAYKQKVCADCMREHYVPLIINAEQPVLACPGCGISTVDDMDACFLTYCLPGSPRGQSEMPLCAPCAAELRIKALTGAHELEDRGVGVGGPQLVDQSSTSVWDQLGLAPERRNG